MHALCIVAVEQAVGGLAIDHKAKLPAEIVDVLHARVGPARAEGRHLMRRIACEDHRAVAELFHTLALERID